MIKGCQKKIIHITNTGSAYFDEAYFILKAGENGATLPDGDDNMVREAMRIAGDTLSRARSRESKRRKRRWSLFLYGAAACSFLFGLSMLLILAFSQFA